jgi:hypothetical protein
MLLQVLNTVVNQGVDIQLKIVQTLLLLLTYCPGIHDEVLSEVSSFLFHSVALFDSLPIRYSRNILSCKTQGRQ